MSGRFDWDKDRRRSLDYKRRTAFVGDPPYKEQPNHDRDLAAGRRPKVEKRKPASGPEVRDPFSVSPKKEVFYLLDRKAGRLTPLDPYQHELREGQQYAFKSAFQATESEDSLLIRAFPGRGSLHYEVASCSTYVAIDSTIFVTIKKQLFFRAVPLTGAPFFKQCAAVLPKELDFEVFRAAVLSAPSA